MKIKTSTLYTLLMGLALVACALVSHATDPGLAAIASHTATNITLSPDSLFVIAQVPAIFSAAEINKKAKELSNYNGNMSRYDGSFDDLVAFEGDIRSFAQELDKNLEKQFTVSVVNANAASRTAALFAGYLKGNATLQPGQLVEGAFNDINGNAGLTGATVEAKSIEELLLFLNACPTRLLAMKIQSTVSTQINNNLTYQRLNPFVVEATKTIRPKNYINQDTYQNDQVTFPVDVQLDQLASLKYPFIGTSTTTVTFFFGASLSIQYGLERKFARAKATMENFSGR